MSSFYIHIPFCLSKCHYCSFSSCAGAQELYTPYVTALKKEIALLSQNSNCTSLDSLFIGGGTPTCIPVSELSTLVRHCLDLFGVAQEGRSTEISVEANPGSVDEQYLETLLEAGVNRLSIGVQSFSDRELNLLGRTHDEQEARTSVEAARAAGFTNINLDLMYGLPGQTPASWQKSLEQGLSLFPKHLSLYQLTIEPHTPFYSLVAKNRIVLPSEDEILEMDEITIQLCRTADLHLYEISNYAVEGYRCQHNINYWLNNEYYAAGASAVSYIEGARERRVAEPGEYIRLIEQQSSVVVEKESLSREASFRETVIMGLRMVQGVSRETLYKRYGVELEKYYGSTLTKLIELKLLELTDTHLCITDKGRPLANQVLADLV
jgi:oxygen-independent coproporphyrinogen-3 oxidase